MKANGHGCVSITFDLHKQEGGGNECMVGMLDCQWSECGALYLRPSLVDLDGGQREGSEAAGCPLLALFPGSQPL